MKAVSQILSTAESPPPAAQRSTNPYSILRSFGRLKIVISTTSEGSNGAISIARRLANDLLTYFKLDADIVPESEMEDLETTTTTTETRGTSYAGTGTGNIVVIGGPSGQYIRRCLTQRRTAFSIADQENGPPVLQLNGEPLNGLSQGKIIVPSKKEWISFHHKYFLFGKVSYSHIHTNPLPPPQCCS